MIKPNLMTVIPARKWFHRAIYLIPAPLHKRHTEDQSLAHDTLKISSIENRQNGFNDGPIVFHPKR